MKSEWFGLRPDEFRRESFATASVIMEEEPQKHPADIADQLERLPAEEAWRELRGLPRAEAAAVLAELDHEVLPALLEILPPVEIARFVHELSLDEAADIVSGADPEVQPQILEELPAEERQKLSQLLTYPPESAGGIMSDRFIALPEQLTIGEARRALEGREGEESHAAYMYVVDQSGVLKGVLPLHHLVFRPPDRAISEIMNKDVQHVWVDDDQEQIAHLFDRYKYMALPVLDHTRRLAGIVRANQVLQVVRQEATEDMQLMVGLSGQERALTSWRDSMRRRLPWLCLNLGTGFIAATVVGIFEETIAAWTALAIFLPIVAGLGGNAGAQTLIVIIRDMALGEISKGDGRKAFRKELFLGLINGVVLGSVVGVISYIWKGSFILGAVVTGAMVLNLVMAGCAGVLVPFTLRALKIDPALASSIIMTSITDISGFFFFLWLATLAARYW